MRLIHPTKLLDYLQNPENTKYKLDKTGERCITVEELIKAIETSSRNYPYINNTEENLTESIG